MQKVKLARGNHEQIRHYPNVQRIDTIFGMLIKPVSAIDGIYSQKHIPNVIPYGRRLRFWRRPMVWLTRKMFLRYVQPMQYTDLEKAFTEIIFDKLGW